MTGQVRIRVCAALAAEVDGRTLTGPDLGSRKARTLVALLAAERGRLVPVDQIAEALWPTDGPVDPAANVSTLVSRTRRLLGEQVVLAQGRTYGLAAEACTTDLDEARGLVEEAVDRLAAGETALAAAAARRALRLLGPGPALVEEPDDDWVLDVRREADGSRRTARHLLARSVTATEPAEAVGVAADAVAADPYDERALRDLMRAHVADGRPSAALTAYDGLAARLRDGLGTDPDPRTSALHLAVLREEVPEPESGSRPARERARPVLVGREDELGVLDRRWAQAGAGRGGLVLLDGEPGIGKTRLLEALADLATGSGGLVLRGRCHPAERSLFLQPYVDVLRPVLLARGAAELGELLWGHTSAWVSLVPELADLVAASHEPSGTAAVESRRAYDAVAAVLRRLSRASPLLLEVDDLQEGGAATVELLAYLARRLDGSRVLLVGSVRSEDVATVGRLSAGATRVSLEALPPSAVEALASAAGLSAHAGEVLARTAGHPLSVVECLRALAAGDAGVPESLAAAVRARVERLAPQARQAIEAAAVLGGRIDPRPLAAMVEASELSVVRVCEELALLRLLHRTGAHYEFANDLVQECVHRELAPALAAALHRRAADLFADRPETMAEHAWAAGEPARAARGWLLAGGAAMERSAVEDAVGLLDRALGATSEAQLRARILLARARAHEAAVSYAASLADIDEALALAHECGDRRLEMAALRARGGDAPVALRLSMADVGANLEAGLHLAADLGDRPAEADFTTRLTVLDASRLRLATALARAERGLARARAAASPDAVPLALDGVKTVLAYLGEGERLRAVVTELRPLLHGPGSAWLLQWAIFESSFAHAAEGRWEEARACAEEALEVNRRSGYSAYAAFFRAHLGWFARLTGDLDAAVSLGRRAVAESSQAEHPWWYATAAGLLAGTLVELEQPRAAAEVARRGLAPGGPASPEAWRLRCLAPWAAATEGPAGEAAYVEARRLLDGIECPPRKAWIIGADCYLLLADAARRRDDSDGVAAVLRPLRAAVDTTWEPLRARVDAKLAQTSSATS